MAKCAKEYFFGVLKHEHRIDAVDPNFAVDRRARAVVGLLRYLDCRILMGVSRSSLMASRAARLAPLLSTVTVSGTPFWAIDFSN
jgi:hypothetical protein